VFYPYSNQMSLNSLKLKRLLYIPQVFTGINSEIFQHPVLVGFNDSHDKVQLVRQTDLDVFSLYWKRNVFPVRYELDTLIIFCKNYYGWKRPKLASPQRGRPIIKKINRKSPKTNTVKEKEKMVPEQTDRLTIRRKITLALTSGPNCQSNTGLWFCFTQ
jgi:hypothetical protein